MLLRDSHQLSEITNYKTYFFFCIFVWILLFFLLFVVFPSMDIHKYSFFFTLGFIIPCFIVKEQSWCFPKILGWRNFPPFFINVNQQLSFSLGSATPPKRAGLSSFLSSEPTSLYIVAQIQRFPKYESYGQPNDFTRPFPETVVKTLAIFRSEETANSFAASAINSFRLATYGQQPNNRLLSGGFDPAKLEPNEFLVSNGIYPLLHAVVVHKVVTDIV